MEVLEHRALPADASASPSADATGQGATSLQSRKIPSCDACRVRKIKCLRGPDSPSARLDSSSGYVSIPPCKACLRLDINCVNAYQRKRRGPVSQYLRRLAEFPGEPSTLPNRPSSLLPTRWSPQPISPDDRSSANVLQAQQLARGVEYEEMQDEVRASASPDVGLSWSSFPKQGSRTTLSTYLDWTYPSPVIDSNRPTSSPPELFHQVHPPLPSNSTECARDARPSRAPPVAERTTGFYPDRTEMPALQRFGSAKMRMENKIEDVVGRDTAIYIISLFFDYLHPLIPCVHRPTFLAQLNSRDEEKDPLFFALLMSILASTLVQLPKTLVPVDKSTVKDLAQRCHLASRAISVNMYDPPSLEMVVIRYNDSIYHLVSANPGHNVASIGESQQLAFSLGLHDEKTYIGLDPITTEIARRMFTLLFVADKGMACLRHRPIGIRGQDCTAGLPRELDDDYITKQGYLIQPPEVTSTIAGFNAGKKIFEILGDGIAMQRDVRSASPIAPEMVLAKMRELDHLSRKLSNVLSDLPAVLTMAAPDSLNLLAEAPAEDWATLALGQLESYFENPVASRAAAQDSFLVSQGNIYVTHALTRFVLIQCRDDLLHLSGPVGTAPRAATERVLLYSERNADSVDVVLTDLLTVLRTIPIQALAVNGPSLVHKVRFVASSLLDSSVTTAVVNDGNTARPQSYLLEYLEILTEIERNLAD